MQQGTRWTGAQVGRGKAEGSKVAPEAQLAAAQDVAGSLCNGAPRLCPRPVAEESGRKAWHSSARRMCDRKVWHSSAAASAGPEANVEVWTNEANV